jgi:hypothetical protein
VAGGLLRDAADYAVRLARQRAGSLVGLLGFALALVSGAIGHTVGLPAWAWGLVAEGGLVLAGFLDWRTSRRMPPEHLAWLKEVAGSVHDSVRADGNARYVVGGRADDFVKTSFDRHFPEFTGLLEEWKGFEAQKEAAVGALRQAVWSSSLPLCEPHPSWNRGVVINGCYAAVTRNLLLPPPLGPTQLPFAFTGAAVVHGKEDGGMVVVYVSKDSPDAREMAHQDVRELNAWATQMHASPPADECRRIEARRLAAKTELLEGLLPIIHAHALKGQRCSRECEGR